MFDNILKNNYNVIISGVEFEWDIEKNNINISKHKIPFEKAATVFFDLNARVYYDPEHSEAEERYIIIGYANTYELLVVCHCYRREDEIVRIISARNATLSEASQYRS